MRSFLLSGVTLLAAALPALAQSGSTSGLRSSSLGSSGLSSSSLGGSGILGGSGGSGSSGSFIGGSLGGSGSSSGSFLGATSGTTTSRSGSGTQAVGSTTFLGPYYGNPLSQGIANSTANTSGTPTFATPLYTITGTGGSGGSTYGGLAGASGTGGSAITSTSTISASSVGVRRAPAYSTELAFPYKPTSSTRTQTDLQQLFSSSERLPSRDGIRVEVDGPTVVLRGTVADEHERRLAEAMARLTPGVHDLRNELGVRGTTAAPSP